MKKIITLCVWCMVLLGMSSCTKDFEEINTNPNSVDVPTPDFVFSKSQLDGLNNNYFFTSILQCGQMMQHYATYKEASGVGDKYLDNEVYYSAYFSQAYPNAINEITLVINMLKANSKDTNKLQIARIWKAYLYHRLTDLYGDIPYTDAAKAYTEQVFLPKYDSQELIYKDLLKELDEAALALDASKTGFGKADLIYNGDIVKWKKFAYSLMLRLGMRLTKVDAGLSKEWVTKAINGGVILNSADNAVMKYTDGPNDFNRNPSALDPVRLDFSRGSYGRTNNEGGKFSKTFIDVLKSTGDPRISVYSGVWEGNVQNTNPAIQKGFPNGINVAPSPTEQATYSEPNQATVLRMDAPMMILGNVETNLYLAEASLRGWYGESVKTLYENAVRASFLNAGMYGAAYAITDATPYLTANPFKDSGSFEEKMNQIHTQIWIGLFVDEQEIYANWRRTSYPVLAPVNFAGNVTNATIPRRIKYPTNEYSVNSINLSKAVERQGRDAFTTRVWWDK
ncbi:SusD/RagB family nutrient-binding outer membrane lipoprotein [Elizabethkingia meningoseptica]